MKWEKIKLLKCGRCIYDVRELNVDTMCNKVTSIHEPEMFQKMWAPLSHEYLLSQIFVIVNICYYWYLLSLKFVIINICHHEYLLSKIHAFVITSICHYEYMLLGIFVITNILLLWIFSSGLFIIRNVLLFANICYRVCYRIRNEGKSSKRSRILPTKKFSVQQCEVVTAEELWPRSTSDPGDLWPVRSSRGQLLTGLYLLCVFNEWIKLCFHSSE